MNKITFPLKPGMQGPAIADLQDALQVCLERSAILADDPAARQELSVALKLERGAQTHGKATGKLVSIFQRERQLPPGGDVDEATANALNALLKEWNLLDQPTGPASLSYHVEGKVVSRVSAGVGGLPVVIVDKRVGGDVPLAQAVTDDTGFYQATFFYGDMRQGGKVLPDLQARAFRDKFFLGASDVHYNASQSEILHVLLDDKVASSLRSEYEVLTSALANHFTGKLGDLKETDEQQDVTYLANKTGWDARAVALTALADQFSARTMTAGAPAIPQPFFYSLFRAGLPANEDTLYHTGAKTLETAWKAAVEQGVIPKTSVEQIPNLIQRFQALSAQKLLTSPALIGASSFKEMLTVSNLNAQEQAKFAEIYAANRDDATKLWDAITASFGAERANRLNVDGKLGFLTINNAPLMQKVHTAAGDNGLSDPLQLAQMGYHRAELWTPLLTSDVPIPKEIPGDTPEAKKANYAEYLAAQVRLSYQTAALAQMIKSGDLLKDAAPGASDKVSAFLTKHQGEFEIGVNPVQQFIKDNKLTEADVAPETVDQLKRLQRVYQITPSDKAMIGLMSRKVDSAYQVVRYDRETFVRGFADDLGGENDAARTYDRSVQVHNTVLNVALSYLYARTVPAIGVHSPASVINPVPANASDIIAYATLESLFGSMDFCACDHCRSLLSPAAYLVDLLQFLSSDPDVWDKFRKQWEKDHGNVPYPFVGQDEWNTFQTEWSTLHPDQPPNTEISPFDVLMSRRPDIQHLPLTCENTNTVLPYIDIVNETLEYFVASVALTPPKLSLDGYEGHDTGGVASEDLLANPQFVNNAVYDILHGERFPLPLPFHQPLENLRRYFNKFEVPLPLAMERLLRQMDNLERGANPYGWTDILMEEVGLSRAEYKILTDSKTVPLGLAYGFRNGTDVIAGLSNAKQFARRVGITYEDLIAILKTRFINPNSDLIPKLERLGVSFRTLKALKDGTLTDPNPSKSSDEVFDERLGSLAVPPDPAMYGGDPNAPKNDYAPIRMWVKDDANDGVNYARIMGIITLAIPQSNWKPSIAYAIGDCVRPLGALPDSTLYYECTTLGTTAAVAPAWPTTPGAVTDPPDGTVVWTCRDEADCHSFDNLAFRYADPAQIAQNIDSVEFFRLIRFIRLWKKLGWTIDQTDAAICALYRADLAPIDAGDIDDVAKLNTGFLTLLPRLGIVLRVIKALNLTVKRDLLPLLACFAPIDTHDGVEWVSDNEGGLQQQTIPSFFRQMFLNPAILEQDPVFADNGYGEFLQDGTQKITGHAEALRAALNLTGEEFSLITTDLGFKTTSETPYPVSIVTKATLWMHALDPAILNAAPGIGYDDTNKLLTYAGVLGPDTRKALRQLPASVADADFQAAVDALFAANSTLTTLTIPSISAIYRRGWLARKMKLSVRELLLLIRLTGLDPFASPDPTNPAILRFIELVQSMKDRSFKTAAALYLIWNQDLSGKSAPDPAQVAAFARTLRIGFAAIENEFVIQDDPEGSIAQTQMALVYGADAAAYFFGLLNDTSSAEVDFKDLDGTFNSNSTVRQAIENASGKMESGRPKISYDDFRKQLSFVGVLTASTRDAIKSVAARTGATAFQEAVDDLYNAPYWARYPELQRLAEEYINSSDPVTAKRNVLLKEILPELVSRRKEQEALQAVSSAAQTSLDFAQTLLSASPVGLNTPPAANILHAVGHADQPALNDFLALETHLDGGISGVWSGYLEAPESGFYKLLIETDPSATVTLKLDGKVIIKPPEPPTPPLTPPPATLTWTNADQLELRAGTFYSIELTVKNVPQPVRVQWEWEPKGQGRAVIPARCLYPAPQFEAFQQSYIRFLKASSLATTLGLTAKETARPVLNGEGWLNTLPVGGGALDPHALLPPLRALLEYARIKAAISPGDESLLTVLEDPGTKTQSGDSLLLTLARWSQTALNDLLTHFGHTIGDLTSLDVFRRVYDAFTLSKKMGIAPMALIAATTNEPTGDTVRALQAALRARYDATSWRDLVRPINDEMRALQRDALVAYILHQMRSHPDSEHIDTPDKLFEYFLMDVQMDPCMQTSRIRHALSSVQLFIERCLMNLEPRVSPEAINAKQWEWMKRYRVWEANRRVFLYPENWLEPELRDDKSPFFKEVEGELLQSDITEDSATTALLNYLSKLEEVAKLEPCGIHYVERSSAEKDDDVAHVVARTAGAPRKYYYRRCESGLWTPWEQIKLDIEDNPVVPVVWNGRLLLFWLRILKKPSIGATTGDGELLQAVGAIGPLSDVGDGTLPGGPWHPRSGTAGAEDPPPPASTPSSGPVSKDDLNEVLAKLQQDGTNRMSDAKMMVQAVLCWSEYYNGKWQPTKTTDVHHPTTLMMGNDHPRTPTLFGPDQFERSSVFLEIYAGETSYKGGDTPRGSALRIAVNAPSGDGGQSYFYFYNTHGLPVRLEDDIPENTCEDQDPEVHFQSGDPTTLGRKITQLQELGIEYDKKNQGQGFEKVTVNLLLTQYSGMAYVHVTEPSIGNWQLGYPYHQWDAPFFVADITHVFYVKTTRVPIFVPANYGVMVKPGLGPSPKIPPLMMRRSISKDTHIHQGIGTTALIMYDGRRIGPSGGIRVAGSIE